jgi:hypothetical protein
VGEPYHPVRRGSNEAAFAGAWIESLRIVEAPAVVISDVRKAHDPESSGLPGICVWIPDRR